MEDSLRTEMKKLWVEFNQENSDIGILIPLSPPLEKGDLGGFEIFKK